MKKLFVVLSLSWMLGTPTASAQQITLDSVVIVPATGTFPIHPGEWFNFKYYLSGDTVQNPIGFVRMVDQGNLEDGYTTEVNQYGKRIWPRPAQIGENRMDFQHWVHKGGSPYGFWFRQATAGTHTYEFFVQTKQYGFSQIVSVVIVP